MEPNDRYLCIVPDRRTGASPSRGLVLPFEGDTTLTGHDVRDHDHSEHAHVRPLVRRFGAGIRER